jgi:NAD(P)H-hydrate epimerase
MIKVVTAEEMGEMDRYTIKEVGVPGVVLMENAGAEIAQVIVDLLEDVESPLVHIFCGKGNNGGDGFVIARHLSNNGVDVAVLNLVAEKEIKGDALINYKIIKKMGIPIKFIRRSADLAKYEEYESPDIIVDALLGTGIKGAVRGFVKDVIDFINDLDIPVVSVDLPSGLNANTGELAGSVIIADVTVSMALPKRCHLFYPAKNFVGDLHVADIGMPNSVTSNHSVKVQLIDDEDIQLPYRSPDAHKYQFGRVAILAGSPGYTGAAALAAEAALRIGSGMVILGIPESLNPILEQKLTEVITRPLPETNQHTIGNISLSTIEELLDWCDLLAIGPGLGRDEEVQETIIHILKNFSKPTVIDADALFALANHPEILKKNHPNWILTPHTGEFLRFLPKETKTSLSESPISIAQNFTSQFKLNLILKGATAFATDPEGNVYINSTGNSGLASGGSGDVLTGMIAGLLAQKLTPIEAAYTANFLHGFIADVVAEEQTEQTLVAGDIIKYMGNALKLLEADE